MNNNFNESVNSLLSGLNGFVSSKTVIGEPIVVNDVTLIPLTDIQVGIGAGAYANKANTTGGGMGAKLSPSAVLLIQKDGAVKLINIKGEDAFVKVLDKVPDVVDRLNGIFVKKDPAVDKKVDEIRKEGKKIFSKEKETEK